MSVQNWRCRVYVSGLRFYCRLLALVLELSDRVYGSLLQTRLECALSDQDQHPGGVHIIVGSAIAVCK